MGQTRSLGPLRWISLLMAWCLCWIALVGNYRYPFPLFWQSLENPVSRLSDFVSLSLGFRRLSADMAWIQTLQYYGTREPGQSESDFENGRGKYPLFLAYCRRVVQMDPYFIYVYLYGASALGWNLDRPSEAEQLLKLGIQHNPKEWRLRQYLVAMAYQKNHKVADLKSFFESVIYDPECPNLLRSILANLYKKQGQYLNAIQVWKMIYETGDLSYQRRALQQIHEMQGFLSYKPS